MSEVGDTRAVNHTSRAIKLGHVRLIRYKCLYNRVFKTVASRFMGDVQEQGTGLDLVNGDKERFGVENNLEAVVTGID